MKKRLLPLSLMFFVATAFASGCSKNVSDVKNKIVNGKSVLYSINGENYFVDDLISTNVTDYDSFFQSESGTKALYQAVEDALIQQIATGFSTTIKNSIQAQVELKMEEWNDNVEAYATGNGISKRAAQRILLEQQGFEEPKELELSYTVAEQRKEVLKQFKDLAEPSLVNTADDTLLEKYVNEAAPMVVKHILVKIGNSSNVYTQATISESEASKLGTVCNQLAQKSTAYNAVGYTPSPYNFDFADIAIAYSEDSSANVGGNLGIVDTYTPFVNEFKFGLYAAKIAQQTGASATLYQDKLGVSANMDEKLFGTSGIYAEKKFNAVSVLDVCSTLANDYKEVGNQQPGVDVNDYKAELFPRNIAYNKYFNFPGVQFLTTDASAVADTKTYSPLSDKASLVLDSDGNPIVVAKSSHGVHFISATYDSLAVLNTFATRPNSGPLETVSAAVKYFMYGPNITSTTNGDRNYYNNAYVKNTFFNQGSAVVATAESSRRTEIDNRVSNYTKGGYPGLATSDELHSFELYQYYLAQYPSLQLYSGVDTIINQYIQLKRGYYQEAIANAVEKNWNTYFRQVAANQEFRSIVYGS